ncbi:two-component system, OmpR family, phosphate regulon response regulator PhoB [Humidesulfovibrio mexicanus]|uniref:Two-component system, OmpR family, phosphate regulon response regulator PhoB n=1 Tax=Humidesulfovibrio mexicanus TaxID=147047 RepID=A0A239A1I0_9BACT|nr:response regulator transcription factor [Humidesulfovibrio mexicanus]SNR89141.1 two-component system, OmpR family, phosphate regulon response regulator PhoB [Humidesulfovibrio mexicanus]
MSQKTVLVVEDHPETRELLCYHLTSAGYVARSAGAGQQALELAQRIRPDLVLLDVMLPGGMDGLEICRRLKQDERTRMVPVIMLTALGDEVDRIVGLELGAEDYVSKPFSPRELLLRVKALLRRAAPPEPQSSGFSKAGLCIDFEAHSVSVDGQDAGLTATEHKILRELVAAKGRVLPRERLLDTVWDTDFDGTSRTVDTHMRRLRGKLGVYADWIETVRGVGYRFKPVEPSSGDA